MIGLFHACCSTIISRAGCLFTKSPSCGYIYPSRIASFPNSGVVRTVNLGLLFTRLQGQCYSTKKSSGVSSRKPKADNKPEIMKDKEEFFVVRKGDLIGVYKSLSDCQAQVGTSISDSPVSVFKGCNMPKDTEKYLVSCGLKNALHTIRASDLTEGIFGPLASFPIQVSPSGGETSAETLTKKRPHEAVWSDIGRSCTLEFDGASKGNPGQAGAGAILRSDDGSLILRLREGLGVATNNVAEYRAFILGLRRAIERGFTSVRVRGDSKLVCMQIQGLWKVKNQNISKLVEEANKLKDKFVSFQIMHILRDLNSEADAQANFAVELAEGQIQEDIDK